MVNQICTTVFGGNDRVMALRTLAIVTLSHIAPAGICTEDVHTTVAYCVRTEIQLIAVKHGINIVGVNIRAVRLFRTEHSHLIAAIVVVVSVAAGSKSSVSNEEEIVATDILYVTCLARHIIASSNLLAEIRILSNAIARSSQCILHIIVAQTSVLVEFQHPDATTP